MSALWADTSGDSADSSPDVPGSDASGTGRVRPSVIEGGAGRRRLGRVPFVLVLIGIFGVGMAGLLTLNTTLQGQAFEAQALHQQANRLTYQQAALAQQVDDLRSADKLAARAFGLGMRPNPEPAFLKLPNGKVIGKPTVVRGNEVPGLVKSPEQIAAEREAKEAKKKAAEAKKQAEQARREADKQAAQKKQAEQKQAEQNQQTASGQTGQESGQKQQESKQQESNGRG
ncbi:hypothetical protein FOE78_18235 [Microlunatus elymi]|uniref:Cell division protein FtsB n=1 Tax=Microlunatus elymi TaxID=2596828 RepID=A0A516Q2D4_9ACTN|nr:hypothetical protein [Microlunatus elymi]QDP97594.1 hypothetical protein FOE78_18235 [Microlunatus elymi]